MLSSFAVFADEGRCLFTDNGIDYQCLSGNGVTVVGFSLGNEDRGRLVIPQTVQIDGVTYTVEGINEEAFANTAITILDIDADIKNFGMNVFSGCDNLENVYFNNNNIDYIPEGCFRNCKKLTYISLPLSLEKVGAGCFEGCSQLSKLDLPSGLKEIGEDAFRGCSLMDGIYLHCFMLKLGDGAFADTQSPFLEEIGYIFGDYEKIFSDSPITVKSVIVPGYSAPRKYREISKSEVKDAEEARYALIPNSDIEEVALIAREDIRYTIEDGPRCLQVSLDLPEGGIDLNRQYPLTTPIYVYIDLREHAVPLDKMVVMYNGKDITSTVIGNRVTIETAFPYSRDYYWPENKGVDVNRILILNRDEIAGLEGIDAYSSDEVISVYSIDGRFIGSFGSLTEWKNGAEKGIYIVSTSEGNVKVKI